MKVYDITDSSGRVFAFEVGNALLGRRGAYKIARAIPGVTIIRAPRWLPREEVFCEFVVEGQRFKIWEPYGDNSRYWVGPEPPQWCEQVTIVRQALVQRKALGFRGA